MKITYILLAVAVSSAACSTAVAGELVCPCKVVKVVDGDTIYVIDTNKTREKIRLAGIDAPEKKQAYGQKSKQYLSSMAASKKVDIEYRKKDRYGRIIGKVLIDQIDVNLKMIKAGLAWHYKQYEKEQSSADRKAYSVAESSARQERVGLWKDETPVAPWFFRQKNKQ